MLVLGAKYICNHVHAKIDMEDNVCQQTHFIYLVFLRMSSRSCQEGGERERRGGKRERRDNMQTLTFNLEEYELYILEMHQET